MNTYAWMKAIAISNPVNAIINVNGITEINSKIGPPITAFHVNVEKIFNRTCPPIILAVNRNPKLKAIAKYEANK